MIIEQVKMTAEVFANKVKKRRLSLPDIDDRQVHINEALKEHFRGIPKDDVFIKLTINTIDKKLNEQDRRATRDMVNWVNAQMSLFDVPGFRLPATMEIDGVKKSWLMVTLSESHQYLSDLSEQVHKEADDLMEAAIQMQSKASEIDENIAGIDRAIQAAIDNGYDPGDLTYEKATSPEYAH